MHTRRTARLSSAAFATCAFAVAASAGTVVEARWLAPTDGLWSDGANWSTGVPPINAGGVLYDVVIDAVGAPYTVRRGSIVQAVARNITIDSSDTTIFHPNLAATDTFRLVRGNYRAQTNWIAASQIVFEKDALVEVALSGPRTFSYLRVEGPVHNKGTITLFDNSELALTQTGFANGFLRNDGVIVLHAKAYIHLGSIENNGELRFVGVDPSPFPQQNPTRSLVANHGIVSVIEGSRRITLCANSSHAGEFAINAGATLTLDMPSHINLLEGAAFTGTGLLNLDGFNPTINGDFIASPGLRVRVPTNLTINGAFTADTYELLASSPTGLLTVAGATTFRNDVSFTNRVVSSGGLFHAGGSLVATRTTPNGSLTFDGGLFVDGNATLSVPTIVGADARVEGNLSIQNVAYTHTAGDLTVLGSLTHTGAQRISIDDGALFVGGNASFTVGQRTLDFDATITGAASLNSTDVDANLSARQVLAIGPFGVRGEIATQNGTTIQRGVFAPGLLNQVGEARFVGDLTLSDNPLLTTRFDLAVDAPRAAHADSVVVEGDLTLGGLFAVTLSGDASLLCVGQRWRLFDAHSREGEFMTATLPGLAGDLSLQLVYDSTGVTLLVIPAPGAAWAAAIAGAMGLLPRRRAGNALPGGAGASERKRKLAQS
ncbi:MAG: polymer-forming cytoskeletal protein [Phycisphaeraceae bacterium]|nr:polymer-forming cytoskeletal protein [Phycisphaeraceae bacterium]